MPISPKNGHKPRIDNDLKSNLEKVAYGLKYHILRMQIPFQKVKKNLWFRRTEEIFVVFKRHFQVWHMLPGEVTVRHIFGLYFQRELMHEVSG